MVLGPNGAGKTTLLEAIAGLADLDGGRITLDNEAISSLPPQKRGVGYVPQQAYLFPNMTVRGNVFYGARDPGHAKMVMETLGISHLVDRKPDTLSGGEQQRVSIARALATKPRILLLDEPFSHLDVEIQEELRKTLKATVSDTQTSAVYVTHSTEETDYLADTVLFLDQGRLIESITTPLDTVTGWRPGTRRLARLLGYRNFIRGKVVASEGRLVRVSTGSLYLEALGEGRIGAEVTVAIRPEDIAIYTTAPPASSQRNAIPVRVSALTSRGGLTELQLHHESSGITLASIITDGSLASLQVGRGSLVHAVFKATAAHAVAGE